MALALLLRQMEWSSKGLSYRQLIEQLGMSSSVDAQVLKAAC